MKITVKNKSEDCGASASSLGAIPTGGSRVRKNEGNGPEYNVYVGQYELIITDKVLGEPYGFIDTVPLYDNLEDDLLADYPSATIIYDQDIKDDVIANVYPWLEGDENTGSVQFADFSNDVEESKNNEDAPKEVNTVLKKNASKLISILNNKFKASGSDARLTIIDPNDARFSDGWYLRVKATGDWDDASRRLNLRLDGTEYDGVIYKDGKVYLKEGSRQMSHRGQVPINQIGGTTESKNESENPISKIYGNGKIVTHVNSADGSFANEYEPIGYAILNNDVEGLKALKNGNPKMPEEPNRTAGWYEEDEDEWRFDWDDAYDKEFREDWERVIGKKDNQEALKQMLEYDRGFIVASIDFDNAIHAGYDKAILKKLFDNIRKGIDDDEDLKINYLGDDDYINAENPDPIANIEKFLAE